MKRGHGDTFNGAMVGRGTTKWKHGQMRCRGKKTTWRDERIAANTRTRIQSSLQLQRSSIDVIVNGNVRNLDFMFSKLSSNVSIRNCIVNCGKISDKAPELCTKSSPALQNRLWHLRQKLCLCFSHFPHFELLLKLRQAFFALTPRTAWTICGVKRGQLPEHASTLRSRDKGSNCLGKGPLVGGGST